ncbi:MAG: hypothetical protein Q8S92_17050 [Hydrogenophaga sp.]|uniref:hypothetical protein n=1 Tax=Hydrogenophaga sp. TaxID=1904254 RepID=UPI002736C1B4|nr:hypothetical protein [Hydrogenophaga sp.]MDP3350702.1 hypothetical protein [Hydrogenophaga sp.]
MTVAVVNLFVGALVALLVNFFSPTFSRWVVALFSKLLWLLDPNRFDLTGTWRHTYLEPTPGNVETLRTIVETVKLKQVGTTVVGQGETDIDKRTFHYSLRINNNMVFGEYVKTGLRTQPGSISGAGMVQTIIDPGRMVMNGRATWFDNDTHAIESSEIRWERIA